LSVLKKNHTPFYLQIAQHFREKIISGEYPINSKIPSEDEIVTLFGVSRMTARNAVTQLVNEGLVYRMHGKGAFVARSKLERNLNKLYGFSEDMKVRGFKLTSKVLKFERRLPDQREQHVLKLQKNQEVYVIKRIRYENESPIGLQTQITPVHLTRGLDKVNLEEKSFYNFLKEIGHPPEKADQRLEAVLAPHVAKILGISEKLPFMYLERVSYTIDDTPIEYQMSHFCGDFYSIQVTLHP